MLDVVYKCPLCDGKIELKDQYDGIKILKCTECKCEIHFGGWEQQRKCIEKYK